jgi:hypothetical protein
MWASPLIASRIRRHRSIDKSSDTQHQPDSGGLRAEPRRAAFSACGARTDIHAAGIDMLSFYDDVINVYANANSSHFSFGSSALYSTIARSPKISV